MAKGAGGTIGGHGLLKDLVLDPDPGGGSYNSRDSHYRVPSVSDHAERFPRVMD